MAAPSEIPPDTLLGGKIRLIKRIGRGGMGDVWVARNESTQAEVAVKTLARSVRTSVHDERFRREARLAATISHRNVIRIFDLVDESDGTLGLVMELLRGGTLEACLRERGTLSALQGVAVASAILSALHHVHSKGIIHRDITPANVFFAVEPDGHVIPKILDFGIAKLPASSSALTIDGSVLGTPHYMSPEQIRGEEELDGRSDMFSVGVVLYEILTGVRPFRRDTAAASLASVLEYEVDPDPRIEPKLWVALSRALAKRPYERYATSNEFADALRGALDATEEDLAQSLQELRPSTNAPTASSIDSGLAISSRPVGRTSSKRSMRTVVLAVGGASVAAVLALVLILLTMRRDPAQSDTKGLASTTPTHTGPTAGDPSPRDPVPPPAAPDPSTITSATTGASATTKSVPRPTGNVVVPQPTTKPTTTTTTKKRDVATKPDF